MVDSVNGWRPPTGKLVERARPIAEGLLPPVEAKDAATTVLLRDSAVGTGVEACLLRRAETMAFAAGMYVFPDGAVDPDDARSAVAWAGLEPARIARVLAADVPLARALVCAAVRETFEESGVLLAGPDTGTVVDVSAPKWKEERHALEAREHSLASLLRRRGLVVYADLLRRRAYWITPEAEPRRYHTRFFIAALLANQRTRRVSGETDRTVWLRPEEALARHVSGQLGMLPPTAFTLAELAEYSDIASVLAAAAARDLKPVLPKVVVSGDEARLLLPHEEGYGE